MFKKTFLRIAAGPEDDPEQLVGVGGHDGAAVELRIGGERHGNQTPVDNVMLSVVFENIWRENLTFGVISYVFSAISAHRTWSRFYETIADGTCGQCLQGQV
jgi:hypothetical protein